MAERLDRERVVRAALALLDEVGLDGLTLRRLAQDLGVKAPALYWHFASKADLLHEMAATMLRDLVDGEAWDEATLAGSPWQDCVRDSATNLRRMLLAHRDGARVFSGTLVTDEALRDAVEVPLGILASAGFAPDDAARASSVTRVPLKTRAPSRCASSIRRRFVAESRTQSCQGDPTRVASSQASPSTRSRSIVAAISWSRSALLAKCQ